MRLCRQRVLITSLILFGIVLAGFFGFRAFFSLRNFSDYHSPPLPPAESRQIETDADLIRDWMTIPYISKTYHVPEKLLFDALGISSRGNEEKSLAQLNEEYSPRAPGIVLAVVKGAVRTHQVLFPPEQIKTLLPPATSIPPKP